MYESERESNFFLKERRRKLKLPLAVATTVSL